VPFWQNGSKTPIFVDFHPIFLPEGAKPILPGIAMNACLGRGSILTNFGPKRPIWTKKGVKNGPFAAARSLIAPAKKGPRQPFFFLKALFCTVILGSFLAAHDRRDRVWPQTRPAYRSKRVWYLSLRKYKRPAMHDLTSAESRGHVLLFGTGPFLSPKKRCTATLNVRQE
jgi:hypothetical protein